jgi:hypothetical protein
MRRRPLKILALLLGAVLALLLILPWLHRDSYKMNAERQWILQAVQELSQPAPPSLTPGSGTNASGKEPWWGHPNYLVFSNGWAAYKVHTFTTARTLEILPFCELQAGLSTAAERTIVLELHGPEVNATTCQQEGRMEMPLLWSLMNLVGALGTINIALPWSLATLHTIDEVVTG